MNRFAGFLTFVTIATGLSGVGVAAQTLEPEKDVSLTPSCIPREQWFQVAGGANPWPTTHGREPYGGLVTIVDQVEPSPGPVCMPTMEPGIEDCIFGTQCPLLPSTAVQLRLMPMSSAEVGDALQILANGAIQQRSTSQGDGTQVAYCFAVLERDGDYCRDHVPLRGRADEVGLTYCHVGSNCQTTGSMHVRLRNHGDDYYAGTWTWNTQVVGGHYTGCVDSEIRVVGSTGRNVTGVSNAIGRPTYIYNPQDYYDGVNCQFAHEHEGRKYYTCDPTGGYGASANIVPA